MLSPLVKRNLRKWHKKKNKKIFKNILFDKQSFLSTLARRWLLL